MHARFLAPCAALMLVPATGHATNTGLPTIEQPVNLGAEDAR